MPRLVTIMGSGETAPTMIKTHRRLMAAVGVSRPGDAVLLDTPYGFQENAEDISNRARSYFAESVGHEIVLANWRHRDADPLERERALAAVADARYVFAGPGSPTYALAQWRDTALPAELVDKISGEGAVTFASAAALTLGVATVPVYEIYKAGHAAAWVDGLDVLDAVGLRVAVIPHYDNAEGGHHDTRFCYLGETRLARLEAELPDGAWILGVDEHTALVIDLEAGTATVEGTGTVTVRAGGSSRSISTGATVPIEALTPSGAGSSPSVPGSTSVPNPASSGSGEPGVDLGSTVTRLVARFDAALAARDADDAVSAALELEEELTAWSSDTLQSDDADRGRAALRRMIVLLGDLARTGVADPRDAVAPFVEAVLEARALARAAKQYELADGLRDRILGAGIEVNDTPTGTDWTLAG